VINTEIKNINIPNVLNITDELNHKCNLTLDKNHNNFPNLNNNSAIELRGSTNLNCNCIIYSSPEAKVNVKASR